MNELTCLIDLEKNVFFEQTFGKNDFIEWTILLNKRFYVTIVQRESELNRWNMNDNFEDERNNFLTFKKTNGERTKF